MSTLPSAVVIAQRWITGPQVEVAAVVHQGGNVWALCTGTYDPAAGQTALDCQWTQRGVTGVFPACLFHALDVEAVSWAFAQDTSLSGMIKALMTAYGQTSQQIQRIAP